MQLTSMIAIYVLCFAFSAFILLPFGVQTDEEAGTPIVPGQAESAPHKFDLRWHLVKAAIAALILFALYYVNWTYGWITPDDVDFYHWG